LFPFTVVPRGNARSASIESLEPRQLFATGIKFTEFPQIGMGTNFLQNLTAGPDGDLYFSSQLANNVASISPKGAVKVYDTTSIAAHGPGGVAVGADGNIYLNAGNNFGMIDLATGTVSAVPLSESLNSAGRMTLGPDGNFWIDDFFSTIERVTPDGQVTRFSYSGSGSGQILSYNGALYFSSGADIRTVGTDGTFGPVYATPSGGDVESLAVGPDGNLWFTEQLTANGNTSNFYGYLAPDGTMKEFAMSTGPVSGIASGGNGNIYVRAADYLIEVNTAGTVIAQQDLGGGNDTDGKELISVGGNVWFNESFNDQIGVVLLAGSPSPTPPPPAVPAALTPAIIRDNLPAQVVAGTRVNRAVTVKIADSGGPFAGRATVALYASTTTSVDGATLIGSPKSEPMRLKTGRAAAVPMIVTQLPASFPPGSYYIVAQVTAPDGTTSAAASAGTVTVAAPFISLAGSVASLSSSVKLGRNGFAVIAVTNDGNIPAAGRLQVALWARPAGATDSSGDVVLTTPVAAVRIPPGRSGRVRLRFPVPATLPAGSYSLVAQLDPNNAFAESALPEPIVSAQTFAVA
jgi:virginiamycin B lyase